MVRSSSAHFLGPGTSGTSAEGTACAWPECAEAGLHRAPTDRSLTSYQWLCLEHVRAFNAAWNYHDGLSDADLEQEFRSAATWDRPTWPMGHGPRFTDDINDPLGLFEAHKEKADHRARRERCQQTSGDSPIDAAVEIFALSFPCTLDELKARYKVLVKEHHPDTNGGSRDAEDRMKSINEAYATLKLALDRAPAV